MITAVFMSVGSLPSAVKGFRREVKEAYLVEGVQKP